MATVQENGDTDSEWKLKKPIPVFLDFSSFLNGPVRFNAINHKYFRESLVITRQKVKSHNADG